jgi:hypothetical protein
MHDMTLLTTQPRGHFAVDMRCAKAAEKRRIKRYSGRLRSQPMASRPNYVHAWHHTTKTTHQQQGPDPRSGPS